MISDESPVIVEAFFAKTKDISSEFFRLKKYIDDMDRLKANKLHFDADRETYLFCHTLLRLILSRKLNYDPLGISIIYDKNNKPRLEGDSLFFNISHTREAFAFAISERSEVGIDLEKVDKNIDFKSIIGSFFSSEERGFILESPFESRNKFFLLWTRKEALLKAIGTGIISNPSHIEVFRQKNILSEKSLDNLVDDSIVCDHYIYSEKILNYYLSVAVPQRAKVLLHQLNVPKIKSYLEI
jgi:4'-phosphopantetheinyl transferase